MRTTATRTGRAAGFAGIFRPAALAGFAAAGIYDPRTKKHVRPREYRASQLSGGYAWYDIGEFDPSALSDDAYLYVGDGFAGSKGVRPVQALYLDRLRFAETPMPGGKTAGSLHPETTTKGEKP